MLNMSTHTVQIILQMVEVEVVGGVPEDTQDWRRLIEPMNSDKRDLWRRAYRVDLVKEEVLLHP